jgi:hypothetical protein
MSAKIEILVERLYDVKIVPVQVVENRGGKKICYVATERGPEEREVQTGAFNNTFVQIVSGLEVGESVLLNPPRVAQSEPASESRQASRSATEEKQAQGSAGENAPSVETSVSNTPAKAVP